MQTPGFFQTTQFDKLPAGIQNTQNSMREMMKLTQYLPLPQSDPGLANNTLWKR
jgi:hypothetical protein